MVLVRTVALKKPNVVKLIFILNTLQPMTKLNANCIVLKFCKKVNLHYQENRMLHVSYTNNKLYLVSCLNYDKNKVKNMMALTFPLRRAEIVQGDIANNKPFQIKSLLERWPALKMKDYVCS